MLRRRPFAALLTLALVAPVTAMSMSAATAAPTTTVTADASAKSSAKSSAKAAAKHLPRPKRDRDPQAAHDPHTVLVKFKKNASKATRDKAMHSRGGRGAEAVAGTGFVKVTTNGKADELASRLSADPSVAEVTLDYVRTASATPNDPFLGDVDGDGVGEQDYLKTVRMPSAWDRSKGSLSTVVAVVDTGVNGRHPDLTGRTVAGFNAITNAGIAAGAASDDRGHGSMVAGIIAAETNNAEGIAGVAWNAKVMPVKVLNSAGNGTDSDVIQGITWAADHGAKIINLSLGGPDDSPALHEAVRDAVFKGAVVIVAAGNSGSDAPEYPAAYPEAIAVGATDNAGRITDFSTHGSWVDIAAPGWGILSTQLASDYYFGDGTSFSAPIVSGIAVLIRTQNPTFTPAQVALRLRATARDAGPRGIDPFYGAGVVDATNALDGGWTADFGQPASGASEPNDVPSRATPVTGTAQGIIGVEGDVDWYRYTSTSERRVGVTATPPWFEETSAQNVDAVISVYDSALRLVGRADAGVAGVPETVEFTMGRGTYFVSVSSFNGSRDTRPYTVSLADTGTGFFDPPVEVPFESWGAVQSTAVADVTGDGRKDVVAVAGYNGYDHPGEVYVLPGTPGGSLGTPVPYPTLGRSLPKGLAVADVDGDGATDVIVPTDEGLQVFRQRSGDLGTAELVPGTARSSFVGAGDLDGDSSTDLVMAASTIQDDGTGTLQARMLVRQADGTYEGQDLGTSQPWSLWYDMAIGDVDGDARPDVVTVNRDTVRVHHNDQAGWTVTTTTLDNIGTGMSVELLDANGDGRRDVVTSSTHNTSHLDVMLQGADGTLSAPSQVPVYSNADDLTTGDVDGNGSSDLVVLHDGTPTLSVLPQLGSGLGQPVLSSIPFISNRGVGELSSGDVTGDGKVDLMLPSGYGVTLLRNAAGTTPGGEQLWVRNAAPADFGSSAVPTAPTVTFARDVVPASVTASTVGILNGKTGTRVPATVGYDPVTRVATIRPTAPLFDNAPYRIFVSGVEDTSNATMTTPFTSTYRTVDAAPAAVGGFKATGAYRAATLTWTAPAINDLDRYIVRMATGSTPPGSVSTGTSAYSGAGTSVSLALTQGTTYSFRIWPKDRSGHYGPSSAVTIVGTGATMSSDVTSLANGGSVTVSGRLTRADTGAGIAGVPLQLYTRRVGTTPWVLLTTRTSNSTGTVAFAHKPTASVDYWWVYRGSTAYVGSGSALRRVGVRTTVTSNVSRTSVPLGGTFAMFGSVSPSHAGRTVYLQRYTGNNTWATVTSRALTSTSTYGFTVKPTARGTSTYRVYFPGDTDHLASLSPNRTVSIT